MTKNSICVYCGFNKEIYFSEPAIWHYGKQLNLCKDCYVHATEGGIITNSTKSCEQCDKNFILQKGREWARICFDCWKKNKDDTRDSQEKLIIKNNLLKFRKKVDGIDNKELQKKRAEFMLKLLVKNPDLKVFEMYQCQEHPEGVIKSKFQTPQYINEYKYCNNMTKPLNCTGAEIDVLDFEKSSKILFEICKVLMSNKQSFTCFYAEGQRSFWIWIFDLDFLMDLTGFERANAQRIFWMGVAGEMYKYLDKSIWDDDHPLPIPYSIHWKHQTPYMEYNTFEVQK